METPKLADHMLQEFGVAALAGNDFGEYGDGYLRFSYANSIDNIKEALTRIEECVKSLQTA
jgi:aspartate/methionine/tyrosine aminotransferase